MPLLDLLRRTFLGPPSPNGAVAMGHRPKRSRESVKPLTLGEYVRRQLASNGGADFATAQANWDSTATTTGAHPILAITDRLPGAGRSHELQMRVFHAMRRHIPCLNAVILNRRMLEGQLVIETEDEGLRRTLEDFVAGVDVGYIGAANPLRGLDHYLDLLSENSDEYGLAAGEIVLDEAGRQIQRLLVPSSHSFSLEDRDGDELYELYQRGRRIDSPLVQLMTFAGTSSSVWPAGLAWSLPFTAEILLRMMESLANVWWVFGDPSLLLGLEYDAEAMLPGEVTVELPDGTSVVVDEHLDALKKSVQAGQIARRSGKRLDVFYSAHGAKLRKEVIGQIDNTIVEYYQEHASVMNGHIVALSETPAWLYPHLQLAGDGLNSNKAEQEALLATTAARRRNVQRAAIARRVLDLFLLTAGAGRFVGRYQVGFEQVSILDEKIQAEAAKVAAEAEAQVIENTAQLYEEDGSPRFSADADDYLKRKGVLPP